MVWQRGLALAFAAGCSLDTAGLGPAEGSRDSGPVRDATARTDAGPPAERCDELVAVVRDLRGFDEPNGHPDFQNRNENEPDYDFSAGRAQWMDRSAPYLAVSIAEDQTPDYLDSNGESPNKTIQSGSSFHDWYHTTANNMEFMIPIRDQDPDENRFVYEDDDFFPIDGVGFGSNHEDAAHPGTMHNYHFTTAITARFQYEGGERFMFSGDDDVWVFVNGKMALDLGGVHSREDATIDFDALAAYLGITRGNAYTLHFFHAERHTSRSQFRIETSIRCFTLI